MRKVRYVKLRATGVMAVLVGLAVTVMVPAAGAKDVAHSTPVTLQLFMATGDEPQPWQITDFEKAYPNITIDVSTVPFAEFYAKEAILAASSSPPDIYAVDQPTMANLAAAGVILPLNKYLPASYINDLTPAAKAEFSYGGKLYSPGPVDTAEALFYNKALLSKAGISPPSSLAKAWTWPEAVRAMEACQVSAQKTNPSAVGLQPRSFGSSAGSDYTSMEFLRSEGSPTAPKNSSSYKTFEGLAPSVHGSASTVQGYINTPEAIAGATFFQDLFTKYKVASTSGNPTSFLDGDACFAIEASNYVGSLRAADVNFSWNITPFPYFKTPIVQTGSVEIAVGAKTHHLADVLDFVKYISSPAQQTLLVTRNGFLPVLSSLNAKLKALHKYPYELFSQEVVQWGRPRPVTTHYLQFSHVITAQITNIADGASPASALNSAVAQLDTLLQSAPGSL